MAISVGSVEVDVVPNTRGIYNNLRNGLVPAATRAGDDAGRAAGRAFGPAMQGSVGDAIGARIGQQIGQQIAARITAAIRDGVRDGVTRGGQAARPAATRQGEETGGAFSRALKARLEAAFRSLPRADVRLSDTGFNADMARLRARMETLSGKRIGIDVDVATALTEITDIETRLKRLGAEHPNVQVRADTAAALAQLAAVRAEIAAVDGKNVDIDTSASVSGMQMLVTAAIAFGPAIIPVLPVVAAGLGAIAAAATAAGAGIGGIALVAVPAFKQIAGVLQAQKQAQDAATSASLKGGQAASQAASRSLQQASAQQSLATAERNGARQITQAQKQVVQAKQAAGQAVQQAAQQNEQAARRVQDAERSLADAQKSAKQAQLDLTAARKQAAVELEDLNNRLTDSRLSQRDAEIALKDATAQRNAVLGNANATELDKQKALLAYDQAVQRLKEQTTETKRLEVQTKAANKAGVTGSATYKAAQDKLAQAQRNVADQQRAVKDAQAEAARVQVQTAQQVAQAQQRVSEATANVAVAQQSAADAVASAQRQIASASMSAAGGVDQAAIAQAKYKEALAGLTPAARGTLNAFVGLRTAFSAWSRSLQPAVMPIFTRALIGLKNALPALTPFVTGAADAIKGLQDRMSTQLKTPFWQGLKTDLQTSVGPAIAGLGVAFGNLFKGMAGIVAAFLPHMDSISGTMQRITKRFANWGANLKGSPEFERFLKFSSEKGPILGDTLGKIAGAFLSIGQALSPLSGPLLQLLGGMAEAIGIVADKAPWFILLIYGIIVAVRMWTIAQAIFNAVMSANPLVLIGIAILALIGFVIYAYNKFAWFRAAVQWVWAGIKASALAVYNWFKGPFVDFFTKTIPGVFRAVLNWVKSNWPWILGALAGPIALAAAAIYKNWDSIKKAFNNAWNWIKDRVLYPIRDFFTKTIPGWAGSLATKIVDSFKTATDGIKNAWDKLRDIARKPVQYVVDVVYNRGIRGVWNAVAGAFGAPKLDEFKFASGGIMPGYTPGRDVHRFVSPTGGALELSGGEAIMRPEFTRAVGSGFVGAMNSIAKNRGAQGVKAALAPVFGGSAPMGTDTTLRYADGGIFGWIGGAANKVAGAGSAAWNNIKKGASWLTDTLEASARAGVKHVVDPLLKSFPGMDTGFGRMIRGIPTRIIDALFGYSKDADKKGGGGLGGPRIQAALKWAKTQNGLPYQWAGNGNPSWDCSGFMSAIESVIRGQKPHRRWATMAFSGKTAPPGWVYHGNSPFKIGITNAGVGHTAGTLGKTNVESRGGDGVVVGSRARGYKDSLFSSWYGFQPGKYDSGGLLQPGLNLAFNGTGRPEPVLTSGQWRAIQGAGLGGGGAQTPVVVELHPKAGTLSDFIDVRVQDHQQQLIQVINAG